MILQPMVRPELLTTRSIPKTVMRSGDSPRSGGYENTIVPNFITTRPRSRRRVIRTARTIVILIFFLEEHSRSNMTAYNDRSLLQIVCRPR